MRGHSARVGVEAERALTKSSPSSSYAQPSAGDAASPLANHLSHPASPGSISFDPYFEGDGSSVALVR